MPQPPPAPLASASASSRTDHRQVFPRTIYPKWPESNEESEYWEVPPEHFLAQQGKAVARNFTATSGDDYALFEAQETQTGSSATIQLAQAPASPTSHSSAISSPPYQQHYDDLVRLLPDSSPPTLIADWQGLPAGLPNTSTLAGADFDVDVRSGFLPPEPPLQRLPDDLPESQWEIMLASARVVGLKINGGGIAVSDKERRQCRQWRRQIREMAIIHPSKKLQADIRYARRAHVVLTFLAHFYVHSLPQPLSGAAFKRAVENAGAGAGTATGKDWFPLWWKTRQASAPVVDLEGDAEEARKDLLDAQDEISGRFAARIPASVAIPLLALSSQLEIPPILTYADTVLWNWRFKDPSAGLVPFNLEIVETFSGTKSEEHFFFTSLLIELRGVAALEIMRVCLDECFLADALAKKRVAKYLYRLVNVLEDLRQILHNVRTDCDPATFYWGIRPWFRGGDASPHERKGWYYPSTVTEEASPELKPRLFTGPSAGQSSLIHAIDLFFDVDHAGVKERRHRPAIRPLAATPSNNGQGPMITADPTSLPEDATFMQRMQLYMPGQHRRFLIHLQHLTADPESNITRRDERDGIIDDAGAAGAGQHSSAISQPQHSPLRHLALSIPESEDHPLPRAYDAALTALRSLRDEHMRVATLYIVTQSRSKPPKMYADLNADFVGYSRTLVEQQHQPKRKRVDDGDRAAQRQKMSSFSSALVSAAGAGHEEEEGEVERSEAKGTGGTTLVQFLKACRTNTIETLLRDSPPS